MTHHTQPMEATPEMTGTVLYGRRDRIAFVTLNRPAAKNALDPSMHDALCQIWEDFRDDAAINGWALAGGLELCLACDLRIASDQAMFDPGRAGTTPTAL